MSYEHAGRIEAQLKAEIGELMAKVEAADRADLPDGLSIPDEDRDTERRRVDPGQRRVRLPAFDTQHSAWEIKQLQPSIQTMRGKQASPLVPLILTGRIANRVCKVVSLEQQRRVHGFCQRIGRAIRKVELRLGMNALAVAVERDRCRTHLRLVEGDDLDLAVRQQLPEPFDGDRAALEPQHGRGLMRVDGQHDATVASGDDVLKGLPLGFLEQNGDEGGAIDNDHTALRSSTISREKPVEDRHGRDVAHNLVHARAPRGGSFGGPIARPGRVRQDADSVRARFQRPPDGVLDSDVLRVGQPARKRLGFLREIDHNHEIIARNEAPTKASLPVALARV